MNALTVDIAGHAGDFILKAQFETDALITALVGPSGTGKTTLLKMMAGIIKPDSGSIRLAGHTVFDSTKGINLPPEQRDTGMVFQDARLFPHLTVNSNLLYGAKARHITLSKDVKAGIVQLLDLAPLLHRYPANLSGGERQRVAIGRALLSQPKLLILDEPLTSVDQERRAKILPFILQYCKSKAIPLIFVSHEQQDTLHFCQTIIEIKDGVAREFARV